MSKVIIRERLPWEERWTQPTLEQLLEPQKVTARKPLETVLELLGQIDGLEQELVWYGPAWKWTTQFALKDAKGEQSPVAYVVFNPENAIVAVPLTPEMIASLPLKRLNKGIREGIRSAKCAYELTWATWSPSSQAEAEHIADLVKRKVNLLRGTRDDSGDGE